MFRKITAIISFMFIISACSQIATPLPLPTTTSTARPTRTVSGEERTAAATFSVRTLPPSFTPTFTATITATPTVTATATATSTATTIPEDTLCAEFSIGYVAGESVSLDNLENAIQVYLPYQAITISAEIRNLDTGEVVDRGTLPGGQSWTFDFSPAIFPDIATYEWVLTLSDATRSGLCEQRGTFDTSEEDLFTPSPSPEATAETTIEASEMTQETTIEAPEMTQEATETPLIFPPR